MIATLTQMLGSAALTQNLLWWVGNAVLYGTAAALATWLLLSTAFRRAHPGVHAALWLVVLIKFVVPVGPSWSFSLASAARAASELVRGAAGWNEAAAPAPITGTVWVFDADPLTSAAAPPLAAAPWSASAALGAAYLLCVVVVAGLRLGAYARFARRCRRYPAAGESIRVMMLELCGRLGLRRVPEVRLSDDAPAPFVLGLWRPLLVLSRRQLVRPDELEAVLLHEIAHLRRGDLFVRYLQWLAGTLLFFWPVVAWVNRRIDLAREHVCDEWALRHGRLSAGEYARCLLSALRPIQCDRRVYRPAAMAAQVQTVERRIEMIMRRAGGRPLGPIGMAAFTAALAWGSFVLGGAATADEADVDAAPGMTWTEKSDGTTRTIHGQFSGEVSDAPDGTQEMTWTQKSDGTTKTFEVRCTAEAGATEVQVEAEEGAPRIFIRKLGTPGDGPHGMFMPCLPTAEELTAFLTAHPTADADSNGTLTKTERDAFLAAVAQGNAAAAIQQFPQADLNSDGALDDHEAVMLASGGMVMKVRLNKSTDAATGTENVQHDVMAFRVRGPEGSEKLAAPLPDLGASTRWLSENIAAEPTREEVQRLVAALTELPLRHMLKLHPEADTDGDGRLSEAEHEALLKAERTKVHALMLRHHPEADKNGDGQLTEDEIISHKLIGLAGPDAKAVWVGKNADGLSTTEHSIEVEGGPGVKKVLMVKATETKGGEPGGPTDVIVEVEAEEIEAE